MYLVHQEFTSAVKIYLNLSLSGVVTYLLRGYLYLPINGVCDYTHVPIE